MLKAEIWRFYHTNDAAEALKWFRQDLRKGRAVIEVSNPISLLVEDLKKGKPAAKPAKKRRFSSRKEWKDQLKKERKGK